MLAGTRTLLPPASEGIVEELHLTNTNTLTQNRVYASIGSNGFLVAEPGVVHFGGFEPGKTYSQVVRVLNKSSVGRRVHIITPTTPHFKATCDSKRGLLAPGLAEEITVEFIPEQWRYYYDCLRIHCEPENLLIPIHSYPVMNETKFPSRIDFGKCALSEKHTKRVKIECKVPIEFEFQIREVKSNPCFSVDPMSGTVPAHGHVLVEVTFFPTMLRTEELKLEVRISEFNSNPILCHVTGSSLPGLTRDAAVLKATVAAATAVGGALLGSTGGGKTLLGASVDGGGVDMALLDGTLAMKAASLKWPPNKGGGSIRGGAGGGDAFTLAKQERRKDRAQDRDCRITGPIKSRPPKLPAAESSGRPEVEVDGVFLPDGTLTTTTDVAYVLNQDPGKLRVKDIKRAIQEKKEALDAQQQELGQVMEEGIGAGVHPLERPEVPAHVKAALFQLLLQVRKRGEGGVRAPGLGELDWSIYRYIRYIAPLGGGNPSKEVGQEQS